MPSNTVYVLGAMGWPFIKIGRTSNIKRRIAEVQTGCPGRLELLALRDGLSEAEASILEEALLAQFRDYRKEGEWLNVAFGDISGDLAAIKIHPPNTDVRRPLTPYEQTQAARHALSLLPQGRKGGRPAKALPKGREDEFVQLCHVKGQTYRHLARTFGTSVRVVKRWAEERGLPQLK